MQRQFLGTSHKNKVISFSLIGFFSTKEKYKNIPFIETNDSMLFRHKFVEVI